jgi:hypothetical protein
MWCAHVFFRLCSAELHCVSIVAWKT